MKCPKCGTEHSGGMCPKCGYICIKENENDYVYSNDSNFNYVTFKRPLWSKIIIGIGIAIGFGLPIIIAVFSFIMERKEAFWPDYSSVAETQGADKETVDSSLMTLYEFERLRNGMSKSEVSDIVGSSGELISESGNLGSDYYQIYSYEGYGEVGANAILTFYNLELESKSQYGLEGGYSQSTEYLEREEISDPQVDISQVIINYDVAKHKEFGWDIIEASYTNNTKYTINYLSIKALLNNNEKAILVSTLEVLPGQTSPKFDTMIEKSVPKSAVKILECTFEITDDTGAELNVAYDYETGKYEFY